MKKITFVIPSRNNLEFLKLAYKSIRNLGKVCEFEIMEYGLSNTNHDILILNDASTDGTKEWIESLNDPDLLEYHNPGPERIGIVGMFDKGIEMARTDIIFAYHADMVAAPDLDKNILKHLKPKTVVSATRVEPPLHPPGPEKITQDFGIEADEFKEKEWLEWNKTYIPSLNTTEGIFAPWCMYKEDFFEVGGHDELFAPQSKEDSDLFNRFQLAGYKFIQPWDARVYHFTSRGSRFNKHAGGAAGKNSDEWLYTTNKNMRNFVRKWGHVVKHDSYMKPIVPPKYNIGFVVHNSNDQILYHLEPWCDDIFIDHNGMKYIMEEDKHTKYDIVKRVHNIEDEKYNDILIEFDGRFVDQQNFSYIQEMSSILEQNDIEEGDEFELGIFKIKINKI